MEKPKHNKHDNIWEIRQSGYPSEERVQTVLSQKSQWPLRLGRVGKGKVYAHVENFVYAVAHAKIRKLPAWKLICPQVHPDWGLKPSQGSIYYIVETEIGNLIFRGTYGYWGTGPHESALIEASLEKLGFHFEIRDGDYLLTFLYDDKEA